MIKYMVKPILTSFKMAIRARIQDQIHQIQQSYKHEMINPTETYYLLEKDMREHTDTNLNFEIQCSISNIIYIIY